MKNTNPITIIQQELQEAHQLLLSFMGDSKLLKTISKMADVITQVIENGGKIITCGNGGSHCDAMHFAEELTGRYRNNRPAIGAIAISDASHMACVGNDYGYEYVFSRYIEGVGREGDVLLAISTSGNSQNVIHAIKAARDKPISLFLVVLLDFILQLFVYLNCR